MREGWSLVMPDKESLDKLHVQQRAADELRDLLARIVNEDLPVISWSIQSDPRETALIGTCDAGNAETRRRDFEAWREALNATMLSSETHSDGGEGLRASVTDNYADLTIMIKADF
ncbi:hypothetical protein AB0J71_29865 [Nonomuraea sp. NPDC049637]|uniref:hypothetical protein n=1 Tax=Nonomuraea sp. NPDC049637 TaxID=3154356 RepID=UPI003414E53E